MPRKRRPEEGAPKLIGMAKTKIANGIIKILKEIGCCDNIVMFYGGKRIKIGAYKFTAKPDPRNPKKEIAEFVPDKPVVEKLDPKTGKPFAASYYDEYAADNTLTVMFEGSNLYEKLNYGDYNPLAGGCSWRTKDKFDEKMEKLLKPYGLYYEMHHSYSFGIHYK